MRANKGPGLHPRLGVHYQRLTAGLSVTAGALVYFRPRVWPLAVVAAVTEAAAFGGWWMRVHQPHDWLRHHISLMCGSYVSFVTAFLVVQNQHALWPWILPTVVGTPCITWVSIRHSVKRSVPEHGPASPDNAPWS